jgi:uncharacterized protein YecE (DUF72 family)
MPMAFDREQIKLKAARLAAEGIYIGTSSWKYAGWQDQLYCRDRYIYRGKYKQERFEDNCLPEYAEVFKTVSVDATYYKFPSPESLKQLSEAVPDDFRFGFKVTNEVTIKQFPYLQKSGFRAGTANRNFLNVDLFGTAFLNSCEQIKAKVGVLMFEFSRFSETDYHHEGEFVSDLDKFLGKLPKGWPYAVEMRNANWLHKEYFDCLAKHEVTHVFNSWEVMPPVGEQMAMPGSRTNPNLTAARFLLTPGRKYEAAVKAFKPYLKVKEPDNGAREAAKSLIAEALAAKRKAMTLIYVNNRLEGNALKTIDAMLERVTAQESGGTLN